MTGAGAGLTSLVFLVVAFRFDTIAVSQEYRSRAAQTLALFLTVTVIAVFLTVPQRTQALGIEMMLVAVISGAVLGSLDSAARREQTTKPSVALAFALGLFVTFITLSGLLLVLGKEMGHVLLPCKCAGRARLRGIWGMDFPDAGRDE
jgi:uncharacterized membrane protein (DUF441 family)